MLSSHHTPNTSSRASSGAFSGLIQLILYFGLVYLGFGFAQVFAQRSAQASAQDLEKTSSTVIQPLKKPAICPSEFSQISQALTGDLKEYLNRTYARNKIKRQAIAVSFPDLQPLPIASSLTNSTSTTNLDPVNQIFFSVRSLTPGSLVTSNTAYWLFLVETKKGWRLAMAFQRVGNAPAQDISYGAIADATNTWLRDYCSKI